MTDESVLFLQVVKKFSTNMLLILEGQSHFLRSESELGCTEYVRSIQVQLGLPINKMVENFYVRLACKIDELKVVTSFKTMLYLILENKKPPLRYLYSKCIYDEDGNSLRLLSTFHYQRIGIFQHFVVKESFIC